MAIATRELRRLERDKFARHLRALEAEDRRRLILAGVFTVPPSR